jgi:hypothetical protein
MQLDRVFEVQRNILGNEHPDLGGDVALSWNLLCQET